MNNHKKKLLLLTIPILLAALGSYVFFTVIYDNSKLSESIPRAYQFTLNHSSHFTMFSLFPMTTSDIETDFPEYKHNGTFHGYPIVGKFPVKNQQLKDQLLAEFYKGINDANEGEKAACFNPRHGIRAIHQGKTVDLVICFECQQFEMFPQRKQGYERYVAITDSPQAIFDRALRSAKVPLGPRN